jgi:hypothetical protein
VFPARAAGPQIERKAGQGSSLIGRDDRSHLFVAPRLVAAVETRESAAQPVRDELAALLRRYGSAHGAAAAFADAHASDTQTAFYPLVTHLFQILGFRSDYSRAGVNYQRWDACVWIDCDALPVEIKSPTEEVYLSTKAVRQALENKVILLARGGLATRRELTSLVVGYRLPNERQRFCCLQLTPRRDRPSKSCTSSCAFCGGGPDNRPKTAKRITWFSECLISFSIKGDGPQTILPDTTVRM